MQVFSTGTQAMGRVHFIKLESIQQLSLKVAIAKDCERYAICSYLNYIYEIVLGFFVFAFRKLLFICQTCQSFLLTFGR